MVFSNRYKYLKRYREIILVLIKYGFGTIIDHLGIIEHLNINDKKIKKEEENKIVKLSLSERLRLALEELGPTFIKLGQIISTRPDILPQDIIHELGKLQDAVPAFPFKEVKFQVENELGGELENLFIEFREEPLAAASIAQVHLAKLKSGQQVAVKVQRPGIERNIELDLKILEDLASLIDNHTLYGKLYNFSKMVQEFKNTLKDELDFRIEGENAELFKENFLKDKNITVPSIYQIYTTKCILTMEYIDGYRLNDLSVLEEAGIDCKEIARNLATSIFNQILRDGFFHADPHPGNIMVLPDQRIVFLDLGMVGKLNEERKNQFSKILMGVAFKNSKLIVEAIIDLDVMVRWPDIKKLEKEIDILRDKYLAVPLYEMKIGEFFNELFKLAFSYNIEMPSEFAMLAKTLVTMEGLVEKLDPNLNILEIAEPIAKKLTFKTFSIEKFRRELLDEALDYGKLIKEFPSSMLNFLRKMEDNDFNMHFEFESTDRILKHLDRISNRISFSILILALSFIMAGLIIGSAMVANTGTEIYFFSISILKFGLFIAVLMIFLLIISIFRSGRF